MHFHWGLDDEHGSEHTLNGKRYPLEVHLVHYSCDFYTSSQAQQAYLNREHNESLHYDDNHVLAVIAVIFEIGEANDVLEEILKFRFISFSVYFIEFIRSECKLLFFYFSDVIMGGIREYHAPEDDYGTHLLQLYYSDFDMIGLLPTDTAMIGYQGSLTTPPCYETVQWHIMKNTMTVSEEQMIKFRLLQQSNNMNDTLAPNYRPLQKLNHRKIYQCQSDIDAMTVEKDEIIVNDNGYNAEYIIKTVKDETWFIIGIIAIVICFILLCLMIQAIHYICITKKAEKEYNERHGHNGNKRENNNDDDEQHTPKRQRQKQGMYERVEMTSPDNDNIVELKGHDESNIDHHH